MAPEMANLFLAFRKCVVPLHHALVDNPKSQLLLMGGVAVCVAKSGQQFWVVERGHRNE